MNKNKVAFIVMFTVLSILIGIGVLATYTIINNKPTYASSIKLISNAQKNGKSMAENTEETTIENENFEDLICQSAMIVGINKAIEESKSAEIEDSENDVVEDQNEENKGFPYYIKINYSANTVTVYSLDESGEYTVPVKAIVCSTGSATPRSGVYKTQNKYQWKLLHGGVYGQYSTRITGSILFHSVPYSSSSKNALISRYYDRLGTTASAGCVRLTVADAKWIYDNCPIGTQVEFYSSSNPGPLGKPSAIKISGYPNNIKCWDPTDPDSKNPWHTYNGNLKDTNADTENKNANSENTNANKKPEINTNYEAPVVNNIKNNTENKPASNNNSIKNDTTQEDNTMQNNNTTSNNTVNNIVNNVVNNTINDVDNTKKK